MTATRRSSMSKTSATWPRMWSERTITASARRAIQRSTAWMCGLRLIGDPALVAAVLGGVDGGDVGHIQPLGEGCRGARDQPVVSVDRLVVVLLRQGFARRQHVLVHLLHPGHEAIEVPGPAGLAHAMDVDAADLLWPRALEVRLAADTAGEHIHRHALTHQGLGELAHMAREAALDHRRILPGEDQHTVAHPLDPIGPWPNVRRRAVCWACPVPSPAWLDELRSLSAPARRYGGQRGRPTPSVARASGTADAARRLSTASCTTRGEAESSTPTRSASARVRPASPRSARTIASSRRGLAAAGARPDSSCMGAPSASSGCSRRGAADHPLPVTASVHAAWHGGAPGDSRELASRLHRSRVRRPVRSVPVARREHALRRRAATARTRVTAARHRRRAAASTAGQLPRRTGRALAGTAARRHAEDRAAGQPRPPAAGRVRAAHRHRRGSARLGAWRRFLRYAQARLDPIARLRGTAPSLGPEHAKLEEELVRAYGGRPPTTPPWPPGCRPR